MSEQDYFILRTPNSFVETFDTIGATPTTVGTRGGSTDRELATSQVDLQEVNLNSVEADDLRRDPSIKAIAEPMPLKLIEPQPMTADLATMQSQQNAWGIEAVGADKSNFDGAGVKVAILDTGIDPDHEAFRGVNLVRKNYTTEGDDDINGHGTHCAGTVFGRDVGGMRIGVARGVNEALIAKVLGTGGGSSPVLANAINWSVENGANVINMSLGIDFPGYVEGLVAGGMPVKAATSRALQAYQSNVNIFSKLIGFLDAKSAFGPGTCVIGASGNESQRSQYEIAVAPPAAGNGIISVGALQQGNSGLEVASFSNTQCNVSAPGVNVLSAQVGGGLHGLNGTSMASPHVAGVAALWAQHEMMTSGRISSLGMRSRIMGTASRSALVPNAMAKDVGAGMVVSP